MSIKECYEKCGGDYEKVVARLCNEAVVQKFLIKFLEDNSYESIFENLKENKLEDAFRAAHTLKGVCQNLGLENLYRSSFEVTEALRNGENATTKEMMERLAMDYEDAVVAIKMIL